MLINQFLFIPLLILALGAFAHSCYQRLQLVALGASDNRFENLSERINGMFEYAFKQKRVVSKPFGRNHFLLFWAFMVLLLANGEFLIQGIVPTFSIEALPGPLFRLLSLCFDLVSMTALVCVGIAAARRLFFPPEYLETDYTGARSTEGMVILGLIAVLMIAFFLMNASLIALGHGGGLRPFSHLLSLWMKGSSPQVLERLATASWWVHALVLLTFMNLLPRSKHMHILTAIPNTFFRNLGKSSVVPRETFKKGESFGTGTVQQLSWKDLLDSLTCTECGRCQELCPAHNTGKPLNPRRVVHDIKVNLLSKGGLPLMGETRAEGTSSEEALWSCTTCGSCVSVCPVLIEQMPKIVKMRRHLVQEQARFPEELLNLFENMEQRSNPWGIAPSERTKWSSLIGERPFEPGQTEILFFVGCAGAFDNRSKQVTLALAKILDEAKISWGTLGKQEQCCGDSLRRLGNEFVFDRMARENVALFKEKGVKKIVTQCPHCFTTLKNDYRQYGLEIEVIHHSELINQLIAGGALQLPRLAQAGKVIFHDSCYLGRHNDTYEAPRQVIESATGSAPAEFQRTRESAFCCGAGGGRMWMEETAGTRINHNRVKEALTQSPDTLCVSCPYCMTMMEDGLKDKGADKVRVRDIAELVADTLR